MTTQQALTRRELIIAAGAAGAAGLLQRPARSECDNAADAVMSAEDALARLKEGNARFASGTPRYDRVSRAWRESLVGGQQPFAVILGCADSRVPVELVFDQGFGDLFVIRNAGNVVMDDVAGSIEYAGLHLGSKLIVVMGHEGCGAVTAALASSEERANEPPELQHVLGLIDPAIEHLDPDKQGVIEEAVEANVRWTVSGAQRLMRERNHPATRDITVVGAVYRLSDGTVEFLEETANE